MTRDDIIEAASKAGFNWPEIHTTTIEERLERFAALVAAAEREACIECIKPNATPMEAVAAIRARGNK